MPVYNFQVRDKKTGRITKGKISADNITLVKRRLTASGQIILQVTEQSRLSDLANLKIGTGVKRKDVAIFARQFATMIEAGLPITKCLTILSSQTESSALSTIVTQINMDVEAGTSISEAIARHSKVFPPIFISMIKAGEVGGVLDRVLNRLADHFEAELELRGKIKSAMTYPIGMGVLVMLIFVAMLIFVVPTFEKMFAEQGQPLPALTQGLVVLSRAAISWQGPVFIVVTVILIYAFNWWKKNPGKLAWDTFKLRLPIFGIISKKMALSRFSRTFSTLMAAGVPMLSSLEIVADTAGNAAIGKVVLIARDSVKEGNSLSEPFAQSKIFPPMLSQMIVVGEETGALDSMLGKIADFYDAEVSASVESLTATMEPLLMGTLGGTVGTMVIALYLPMFQVVALVQ